MKRITKSSNDERSIGCISSEPLVWKVQRVVPPHPGPLPWGEGELSVVHSKIQRLPHYRALEMVHPLPEGEGWGEGERTVLMSTRAVIEIRATKYFSLLHQLDLFWFCDPSQIDSRRKNDAET